MFIQLKPLLLLVQWRSAYNTIYLFLFNQYLISSVALNGCSMTGVCEHCLWTLKQLCFCMQIHNFGTLNLLRVSLINFHPIVQYIGFGIKIYCNNCNYLFLIVLYGNNLFFAEILFIFIFLQHCIPTWSTFMAPQSWLLHR